MVVQRDSKLRCSVANSAFSIPSHTNRVSREWMEWLSRWLTPYLRVWYQMLRELAGSVFGRNTVSAADKDGEFWTVYPFGRGNTLGIATNVKENAIGSDEFELDFFFGGSFFIQWIG